MTKNKRHSRYSYSIGFMVLLTLIAIGALALINEATGPRIQQNIEVKNQEKVLEAANLLPENSTDQEIQSLFSNAFEILNWNESTLYQLEPSIFVVPISGSGLWGSIHGYIGINFSNNALLGLSFVSHNETPGLGGRIEEAEFLDQFDNLILPTQPDYLIYRPKPGGNIDAISGATGTSNAVRNFLNADLTQYYDAYARGDFE
jgi:Na+-transporting NADH:ubiquinone oxidoreductase subunit C